MKRALLMAFLSLGLAGCQVFSNPPAPPAATATLNVGLKGTDVFELAGIDSWSITSVPTWLTLDQEEGQGKLTVQATVRRSMFVNAPRLEGSFLVNWFQGDRGGVTRVNVTADYHGVTGQIVPPSVSGADAEEGSGTLNTAATREVDGVLVKYRDTRGVARALSLGAERSGAGERLAVLETSDVEGTLQRLRQDPTVEYAVPNVTLHALGTTVRPAVKPADQYAALQWPFRLLGYEAVWRDMEDHPYPNAVTVAVLDTGVRYDHPDLAGSLWLPAEGGLDLVENDTDPTDVSPPGVDNGSHGTHVAGLIAARWGKFTAPCASCSDSGVVGAVHDAPVKVQPVRVLGPGGGSLAAVATGIRYAAGLPVTVEGKTYTNPHPAKVVNLSLGAAISATSAQPLCEAITEVTSRGVLVVAAGGNDGNTSPYYPAACQGAVAVASVTLGDVLPVRASYSNAYGAITLAAPGGDREQAYNGGSLNNAAFPDMVYSTSWDFRRNQPIYEAMMGTSQAAPQVTALAALLLSKGVASTPTEVRQRLIDTATHLGADGKNNEYGHGLINAAKALGVDPVEPNVDVRVRQGASSEGAKYLRLNVDAVGRFSAYLPAGSYTLDARQDTNANGIYGEANEPRVAQAFTLEPTTQQGNLGTLNLR